MKNNFVCWIEIRLNRISKVTVCSRIFLGLAIVLAMLILISVIPWIPFISQDLAKIFRVVLAFIGAMANLVILVSFIPESKLRLVLLAFILCCALATVLLMIVDPKPYEI